MKVQVQVTDEVHEAYAAEAGRRKVAPATLMAMVLSRYEHTITDDRYLLLRPEVVRELEQVTGRHLTSPGQLLDAVKGAASINIGNIRVEATQGQLNELARRAELLGRKPEELVEETYRQIAKFFWDASELAGQRGW